jgi:LacI family transcriptional regulator, galactose operon repressor
LPAILVNTCDDSGAYASIKLDNRSGVTAVVDHLVGQGRKRLVHIAGPDGNIDAQERAEAFRAAAARHDVAWEIVDGDFEEESGEAAIASLLAGRSGFDAVFAANDNMAIGAIQALRRAGMRVPEDVAVAGFDDIPLARHLGLTTIRVRIAELGESAVRRLVRILAGDGKGADQLHAPELVVRATTDPAGVSG